MSSRKEKKKGKKYKVSAAVEPRQKVSSREEEDHTYYQEHQGHYQEDYNSYYDNQAYDNQAYEQTNQQNQDYGSWDNYEGYQGDGNFPEGEEEEESEDETDDDVEDEDDLELAEHDWLAFSSVKPESYFERRFVGGDESLKGWFNFILDQLYVKGTVLKRTVAPIILSVLCSVIASAIYSGVCNGACSTGVMASPLFYLQFCIVNVILLALRLGWSWRNYQRGHELVENMSNNCIDCLLVVTTSPHVRSCGIDCIELMRKLNLLMALIRQDLRESRQHLLDASPYMSGWRKKRLALENFHSGPTQFINDPYGAPPLNIILEDEEKKKLQAYSPHDRVYVIVTSIRIYFNKFVSFGEQRMSTPDGKTFTESVSGIIKSWNDCRSVVRTPIPFVLHHFLITITFLNAFIISPIYFISSNEYGINIMLAAFNAFALYGLEEAAREMEVPFGWRQSDTSLTKMCRKVLKRTKVLCKIGRVRKTEAEEEELEVEGEADKNSMFVASLSPQQETTINAISATQPLPPIRGTN